MNREDLESDLRALHARADYAAFTTRLIRAYGPELLGFVASLLDDHALASEAFAALCEDFWRGAPDFRFACSTRTWAYTLARHAALRCRKQAKSQRRRVVPWVEAPREALEAEASVRASTAPHLRTEIKDRIRNLRAHLSERDRLILSLRLDRGLNWREIAQVLSAPGELPQACELDVLAVRLRQQMSSIKARLRVLARAEGLLDS